MNDNRLYFVFFKYPQAFRAACGLFLFSLFFFHFSPLSVAQNSLAERRKNIEDARNRGDYLALNQNLVAFALLSWGEGKTPEAIKAFEESAAINDSIKNHNGSAIAYQNIGLIFAEKNDFKGALKYYNKALSLRRGIGNKHDIGESLFSVGSTYSDMLEYEKAIPVLEEALNVGKAAKDKITVTDSYRFLSEAYEKTGNKEKALEFYKLFNSSYNKEGSDYISNIEDDKAKLELIKAQGLKDLQAKESALQRLSERTEEIEEMNRRKQREIELLNKERELKELRNNENEIKLREGRVFIGAVVTIAVMGVLVAFVLFSAYRGKIKANARLEEQNTKILKQNKEIEKAKDTLGAQNKELEKAYSDIKGSITYAKRIQEAMLPSLEVLKKNIPDSFLLFRPRDMVSGDFYWFVKKGGKFIIAAVDCTGHGVPGAFMSMVGNGLLNQIVNEKAIYTPNVILEMMNTLVTRALKQRENQNKDGMDMALCVVDSDAAEIQFAGAKNPLIYLQNGEMHVIKGDVMPIGGYLKDMPKDKFVNHVISIKTETRCYIFSDGYQDQFGGPDSRKFLIKKLRELLQNIHLKPMQEQKNILDKTIDDWMGGTHRQLDDILMIGFKVGGEAV